MNRRLALPLAFSLCLAAIATAALAAPASAKLVGFQTPDEKVGCYMNGQGARCDVEGQKWTAPPPAMPCELDYGFGVEIGRRDGSGYVCAGDTTLDPEHEILDDGEKIKTGRFKCKNVGDNAIKCVNKQDGGGFEVSKLAVELF